MLGFAPRCGETTASIQPQRRRRRAAPAKRGGPRRAGRSGHVANGGLAPTLNYATHIAAYRAELMCREVALQRECMEELTANLVVQIEQMETLNANLNRLLRIVIFSIVVSELVRRVRPY